MLVIAFVSVILSAVTPTKLQPASLTPLRTSAAGCNAAA
jgi:hypothetical protein